jgi:SAM-dependent methyltransferase
MGRFASTVGFYARYRKPYPPKFFKKVAEKIVLRGNESLLDVGCGPALLAIGFGPFVGRCTGLDPETGMIAAAKAGSWTLPDPRSDRGIPNDSNLRCHHYWLRTSLVGT